MSLRVGVIQGQDLLRDGGGLPERLVRRIAPPKPRTEPVDQCKPEPRIDMVRVQGYRLFISSKTALAKRSSTAISTRAFLIIHLVESF
jgi:hypothetical protein